MKEKDTPDNSSVNIDLIRGHMDTIILRTLSDGDKYGYEILSEISDKSEGLYSLKQPTLYSCLKRLEKQGLVTSYKGDLSYGAQRVYYSLTDMGRQFLENDQIQWEFSRTIINNLLSDKAYDPEKAPKPFDVSSFRPLTRRQRGDANYYATVDPSKLSEEELQSASLPDEDAGEEPFDSEYNGDNAVYSEGAVTPAEIPQTVQYYPSDNENDTEAEIVEDGIIPPVPEPSEEIVDYGEVSPVETADTECGQIPGDSFTEEVVSREEYEFPAPVQDGPQEENPEPDGNIMDGGQTSGNYALNESVYEPVAAEEEEPSVAEQPLNYDTSAYDYDEEAARYAANVLYGAPPEPMEETPPPQPRQPQLPPDYNEANYIESLSKLYNRRSDEEEYEEAKPVEQPAASSVGDPPTLNQVREAFYMKGFNLKPYTKTTNAGYYINKYFYSNRLLRDCTLIMFAVFAIELLICAISGGISWGAFGLAAGISLLAPVFMLIIYMIDPNRRKKADYNFKSAAVNCLVFCIGYIALAFILGFFVFGIRADDGATWIKPIVIPLVFMLDAPIALLVYTKLYSSRKYHIN